MCLWAWEGGRRLCLEMPASAALEVPKDQCGLSRREESQEILWNGCFQHFRVMFFVSEKLIFSFNCMHYNNRLLI